MQEQKLIYLKDHVTGYKNILHDSGWERGFKLKGKWHGQYESMGTIANNNAYYHSRGFFKNGIKDGKWLTLFVWVDGRIPPRVDAGVYLKGKKHGRWRVYRHGDVKKVVLYECGKVVDASQT